MTTTTPEIKDKRRADTALALLALAGRQPDSTGKCLTDEQLAAFVEGKISSEQSALYTEHLAGCNACYTSWLLLHATQQKEQARKPVARLARFMGRPQALTTAGSLLAAAACVIVFLNINENIDHSELITPPQPQIVSPSPKPAATPGPFSSKEQGTTAQGIPSGTIDREQEKGSPSPPPWESRQRKAVPSQYSESYDIQKSKSRADEHRNDAALHSLQVNKQSTQNLRETRDDPRRMQGAPGTHIAPSSEAAAALLEWTTALQEVCTHAASPEELRDQYRYGQDLLQRLEAASPDRAVHQSIKELLLALKDTDTSSREKCDRILDILQKQ